MLRLISLFLFFGLLFSATSLSAQKGDRRFRGLYEQDLEPGETELATAYQWMISKTGTGTFVRRTYFPETRQLIAKVTYLDKKLRTESGPARHWYDEGPLRSEVTYENGRQEGEYQHFHPNGQLSEAGSYSAGTKVGEWLSYRNDGSPRKQEYYRAGKLDGAQVTIDSLGVRDTTYFAMGERVDREGRPLPEAETVEEKMPLWPGCPTTQDYPLRKTCADRAMLEYIYRNIRYPARAREYGAEGMAVISFVIETNGAITNIESVRGITEDIRDEVIRLVRTFPRWEPGTQDGKAVRVQFNLPVKFQLN